MPNKPLYGAIGQFFPKMTKDDQSILTGGVMKQNAKTAAVKKTTARKKVIDAQEHIDAQKSIKPEEFYTRVSSKAFELFERRGGQHGYDLEDWFQAERIISEGLES
jgi:hypothetical protein